MKSVIIPLHNYAQDLTNRTEFFLAQLPPALREARQLKGLTVEESAELLTGMFDDMLSNKLFWARGPKVAFQQAVEKVLPWFDVACDDELSDEYNMRVIDCMEIELENMMQLVIRRKSWKVWSIKKVQRDLVLLEGPDYRILDWQRRMRAGEWKFED